MQYIFSFLLLLFTITYSFAQSESELSAKALASYQAKKMNDAATNYSKLVALSPRNFEYNYYYGITLLQTAKDKREALKYLEFAAGSPQINPDVYFYLGQAFHYNYQFKKAVTYYQLYKSKKPNTSKNQILDVDRALEMCQNGIGLLKEMTDITVLEKKEVDESIFYRFYDERSIDGSILVSQMDQLKLDKKYNHQPIIFYPKESNLIFFSSYGDKDTGEKNIYFKTKTSDGWSSPQLIKGSVNTDFDEDFPYFDSKTNKLYFSSKGHNSMGGYDIFVAQYDPNTQTFDRVKNLDFSISSVYDDIFFIPNANQTAAWFASSRESGFQKMSVFKVAMERYPTSIAFIKGIFESQQFKENKRITLSLTDKKSGKKIGEYHTDEKGLFYIPIYRAGDYEYEVSIYGLNKIFPLKFSIPKVSNLAQYGQKIIHKRQDAVDYVELIFLADSEISADDEPFLEVIRERSNLEISEPSSSSQDEKSNDSALMTSYQQKMKAALEHFDQRMELEQKAYQKISNNLSKIQALQYELKAEVGKVNANVMTLNQLQELKQKLNIIDALTVENSELIRIADSLKQENERASSQRNIIESFNRRLLDFEGNDVLFDHFIKQNAAAIKIAEQTTVKENESTFEKSEQLKKQLSNAMADRTELEERKAFMNSEIEVLEAKLSVAKSKEKSLLEQQLESKKQGLFEIEQEIEYLNQKISKLQAERKVLDGDKELVMSISQTTVIRLSSLEAVKNEIAKVEAKNFSTIRNLLEQQYERLANPTKVERLNKNDIQCGQLEFAWETYQNPNFSKKTETEKLAVFNSLSTAIGDEMKRLENKSGKTSDEIRYLAKLKDELRMVQSQKEILEFEKSEAPIAQSTSDVIQTKIPELQKQISLAIASNKEQDAIELFNEALAVIEKQEKIQKQLLSVSPKDKKLNEELLQLQHLKTDVLKAKSDYTLQSLQANSNKQLDQTPKEAWIQEVFPNYELALDAIHEKTFENEYQKILALRKLEEQLAEKISLKKKQESRASLNELEEELNASIQQLNDRLQFLVQKQAQVVGEQNLAFEKAISHLDINQQAPSFIEAASDLKEVISKEVENLEQLKYELGTEKVQLIAVDKTLEALDQTLLILEAKTSEYEQMLVAKEQITSSNQLISHNKDSEVKTIKQESLVIDESVVTETIEELVSLDDSNDLIVDSLDIEEENSKEELNENNEELTSELTSNENARSAGKSPELNQAKEVEKIVSKSEVTNSPVELTSNENARSVGKSPETNQAKENEKVISKSEPTNSSVELTSNENARSAGKSPESNQAKEVEKVVSKSEPTNSSVELTSNENVRSAGKSPESNQAKEMENVVSKSETTNSPVELTSNESIRSVGKSPELNQAKETEQVVSKSEPTNSSVELTSNENARSAGKSPELNQAKEVEKIVSKSEVTNSPVELTSNENARSVGKSPETNQAKENEKVISKSEMTNSPVELTSNESIRSVGKSPEPNQAKETEQVVSKSEVTNSPVELTSNENARSAGKSPELNQAKEVEQVVSKSETTNSSVELTSNENARSDKADVSLVNNKTSKNNEVQSAYVDAQRYLGIDTKTAAQIQRTDVRELMIASQQQDEKLKELESKIQTDNYDGIVANTISVGNQVNWMSQFEETDFSNPSSERQMREQILKFDLIKNSTNPIVQQLAKQETYYLNQEFEMLDVFSKKLASNSTTGMNSSWNERKQFLADQLQNVAIEEKKLKELSMNSSKKDQKAIEVALDFLKTKRAYIQINLDDIESILEDEKQMDEVRKAKIATIKTDLEKASIISPDALAAYRVLENLENQQATLKSQEIHLDQQKTIAIKNDSKVALDEINIISKTHEQLKNQNQQRIEKALTILKQEIEVAKLVKVDYTKVDTKSAEVVRPKSTMSIQELQSRLEKEDYPKGLFYRIQVGAFAKPINTDVYKNFAPVTSESLNAGLIKYMAGFFVAENTAVTARNQIRQLGFVDAFIVAYCDGKRIPVYEARRLLQTGECLPAASMETMFQIEGLTAEAIQTIATTVQSQTPQVNSNPIPTNLPVSKPTVSKANYAKAVYEDGTLYYTVQIGVFNRYVEEEYVKGMSPINTDEVNPKAIRYSVGRFDDLTLAKNQRQEAIEKGFTDAFIVAYYNGKRMSVTEAQKLNIVPVKSETTTNNAIETKPTEVINVVAEFKKMIQSAESNDQKWEGIRYNCITFEIDQEELSMTIYSWIVHNFSQFQVAKRAGKIYLFVKCDKDREELIEEFKECEFSNIRVID